VWLEARFGLVIGFTEHLHSVTTNKYDSLTEFYIPKITVTTAHEKSSQSSLAVAWQRLPNMGVSLSLGSWTLPGLSYQLVTSHNCNSQMTQLLKLKVLWRPTVSRKCVLVSNHLRTKMRFMLPPDSQSSDDRTRLRLHCCWPSPAQSFSGPIFAGLMTIFYCLRFDTPPNWSGRTPHLYPPGARCPSYTPRQWVFSSPPMTPRATVEVFEPAATWGFNHSWVWVSC
jgi:hypothetical protein